MRALLVPILVLALVAPLAVASRNTWVMAGVGESNDCDAVYQFDLTRAQPGTFRWDIRITITPDIQGADGNVRFDCVTRSYEWHDVIAADSGPWRVDLNVGTATCPHQEHLFLDTTTTLNVEGTLTGAGEFDYRMFAPCLGMHDLGEGTLVVESPDGTDCVSVLCLLTT